MGMGVFRRMKWYVGKGIEEYLAELGNLGMGAEGYIKKAVYPAAGLVADEVIKNIDGIPERKGWKDTKGVTDTQRKGLKEGFGIARFQNEGGYVHVKLGFDGYNEHRTEKWPEGQPNAMVARSIEGGTSWSPKYRFVAPAVKATTSRAENMMKVSIDRSIQKIMKV